MNSRQRSILFLVAAAGFAVVFVWGLSDLPAVGDYRGPYGYVVTRAAVYERHATDVVNAINYDYRAFDTLGEEFILFASVLGVLLLFRPSERKDHGTKSHADGQHHEEGLPTSDTLTITTRAVMGIMIVFGVYIATHGQLSPGGGFQGGVILASTPILIYLSGDVAAFEQVTASPLVQIAECGGAAGYAIIGIVALLYGAHFLTNIVPLGKTGDIFSSGNIALISVCVGVEVTGGFVQLMQIYLREIVERRLGEKS